jgi:hypothetical protein
MGTVPFGLGLGKTKRMDEVYCAQYNSKDS